MKYQNNKTCLVLCHPERSEGSQLFDGQMFHFAQHDIENRVSSIEYRVSSIEHRESSKALTPPLRGAGLTLLEMVIAMAIMVIVFAAIVPQFRAILNSWDSKAGAAETIQNGRVLIDHLNRNLSAAVKITAVSDSSTTDGYIEFEDNDGNTCRYDIAANNYVEFGVVSPPPAGSDLAGPASQLQFTCYDACDLDTPITDVESIRFVKVETTLTNSAPLSQDKTFTAWAYLRANGSSSPSQGGTVTYEEFTEAKAGSNVNSLTISTPDGGGGGVRIRGLWTSGLSHTEEAGSNRLLILTAHVEDDDADMDLLSVTYGGQSMTKVIERETQESSQRDYVVAYILNEAGIDAASGDNFSPSWSSTPDKVVYTSVFLANVNQTTPTGASDSDGSNTATTISTSALSTNNGDMVIVAGTAGDIGTYSVNNGFTEAIELPMTSAAGIAGYKLADGSNETPSITHNNPWRQVIIGFVVQVNQIEEISIEGDLLIAAVVTDGSETISPPAGEGWTEIDHGAYGSNMTLGVWWKLADASESSSHQFTWGLSERAYGWIMRFTGHDPTNPINTSAAQGGDSTTPDCPSVTTTIANTMIVRIGGFDDDDITIDNPGLSGHSAITMDESNSGSNTCSGGAGYKQQATIGSSGTVTFDLTNKEEYRTVTIAIAPEPDNGEEIRP